MKHAILLAIDRLGAFCLGPYGNTWVDTPGWNRLAARSLLCEQMIVDSTDVDDFYRSVWQGGHAMSTSREGETLPRLLSPSGHPTVLITDDQRVAESPSAAAFDERVAIPKVAATQPADNVNETQFARGFAAALEQLHDPTPPSLLWIHLQGMQTAWDAPAEMRNQFADEDDPLPGDFVEPPEHRLSGDVDPDDLLRITHAYAGQVAALDACLEAFLDALESLPFSDSTLLAVVGCRGFPLGEHGRVGPCDQALYGELIHVPCLLAYPPSHNVCWRSNELVQPGDLFATLASWLDADVDAMEARGRDLAGVHDLHLDHQMRAACTIGPQQRAIRTPGWFLRVPADESPELFVKPEDVWEVNDVENRRPEVATQLGEYLEQFETAAATGRLDQLPSLPETLREGG